MDPLLTIFTAVVAIALLTQSIAFWGIYRSLRRISAKLDGISDDLKGSAESIKAHAAELVTAVKTAVERMRGVQENLTSTSAIVQRRAVELDALLGETSDAARLQIARIQDVIDNASRRVEDTIEALQKGVIAPVRELSAIFAGIRVGLDVLLRRRKGPALPSDRDGEMFI